MRELAQHALEAVVTMDSSGLITGWNAHAEELFGWTAEEVLGRHMDQIIIPERYRAAHRAGLTRYHLTGRGPLLDARTRIIALHRDGHEMDVEISITALAEATGVTFVGFLRDLSERRRLAEALHDSATQLELAVAERTAIAESLRRLPAGRSADETAQAICRELQRIPDLDIAVVYEFAHDGSVVPIGQIAPPGAPTFPGRPLPAARAAYLRESATGPWIDEWRRRPDDDAYRSAWLDLGLTCGAFVPFCSDGVTHGLISAGTTAPIGSAGVARWLPSLTEFATIAAALLVPELSTRRAEEGTRAEMHRIIVEEDLVTVFQPIVRLRDGSVIGYEALTRFADGTPPDHRFAVADSVGVGRELESAAIVVALREARRLPRGRWVSVNLSPSRLTEPGIIEFLRARRGRPLVVEVTERLAIDDYDAVRTALDRLGGSVEVAVDDAGAGFASLRHILELRPSYVKLDMQLVRGVDADPARQALIAGMVYFARQSGCHLIAEGIETEAERVALRRLGVPFGQGFRFGYPAPASEIAAAERAPTERAARPSARRRTAKVAGA